MDAQFLRACSSEAELPPPDLPEVAVAGRSNCGKSSLINALVGRAALARTSSTPGRTQQIVFFTVTVAPDVPRFQLVDLPGYGYAHASKAAQLRWIDLVESYIERRASLKLLLVLGDIRREPATEEQDLLRWATERALLPLVVLTKADKVVKSERFVAAERAKRVLGLGRRPIIFSIRDPAAVEELRQELTKGLQLTA